MTKNSFKFCPSLNWKAFERELLYEIWWYGWGFIICSGAYNPMYSSSNSFCIKFHLYITVRHYCSFGLQLDSMKSISSSQYLTSVHGACNWLLDVWSLLPFRTWRITTSVHSGYGWSLQVRVWAQTKPLLNWLSRLSINPNRQLGYGSMVNSQPIWNGRVVSGSSCGSIYWFIFGSYFGSLLIVAYQSRVFNNQ